MCPKPVFLEQFCKDSVGLWLPEAKEYGIAHTSPENLYEVNIHDSLKPMSGAPACFCMLYFTFHF